MSTMGFTSFKKFNYIFLCLYGNLVIIWANYQTCQLGILYADKIVTFKKEDKHVTTNNAAVIYL